AQAHPYTPTGKGRGLRGAFLSTLQTGTGTDSRGGSAKEYAVGLQIVGGVLGVASFTAVAVHRLDQGEIERVKGEIKRVEGERAAELKLAAAEIKRVEGERRLSEERLRAEVDRYKYDLQLRFTQDFKPYQAAKEEANKERGGSRGRQKEEKTE
ncbi:hypothetical protein VYU27_005917, partial [Nannochloropsis oceanica]